MTFELIQRIVNAALLELYQKDYVLLQHDIHENTIAHKLACYLQGYFPSINVDFEYNGNIFNQVNERKQIDGGNVKPDIVVHERLSNEKNILIVEIKKTSNDSDGQDDRNRLMHCTSNECSFKYRFGLFVRLGVGRRVAYGELYWYQNGECNGSSPVYNPHLA
jgi:hypothetical protein